MKRRNFLKWLGVSPAGIGLLRKKVEERPEPVKNPEPPKVEVVNPLRQTLMPETTCSFVVTYPTDWYPKQ
jgi:hypothetical protein